MNIIYIYIIRIVVTLQLVTVPSAFNRRSELGSRWDRG